MPFFGEVWLWSLAGFLVGALLCWALVARPARRRVIELEDSLAEARRRKPDATATAYQPERPHDEFDGEYPPTKTAAPALLPGFDRAEDSPADDRDDDDGRDDHDEHEPDGLTAPPEAAAEPAEPPAVAPVESTQLIDPPPVAAHQPVAAPAEVEPGWVPVGERFDVHRLDADTPDDEHLVDDLPDDPGDREPGTIFTQHTTPISGSLIRDIDHDTSLVDDLDDSDPHRGHFAAALTPEDEQEWSDAPADPATRYLPPVGADASTGSHRGQADPLPRRAPGDGDAQRRTAAGGDPRRTPVDGESRRIPADAETRRTPAGELPRRTPGDGEALPKRAPGDAEPLPKRTPGDAEPLPKRTPGDAEPLPKRTAGGADPLPKRTPVGESTTFSPAARAEPTMFTPAVRPDPEATRFSPPARQDGEPEATQYSPAARPDGEPEATQYSPAARPSGESEATQYSPSARPGESGPSRSAPAAEAGATMFTPVVRPDAEPESRTGRHQLETARPEPEPAAFAPPAPEPPAAQPPPQQPGALPKRVPKKPGDRFPFGVRTSSPEPAPTAERTTTSPARQSAAEPEPDRMRSLFEPVRPADDNGAAKAAVPPPGKLRRGSRASQVLPGGVDTFVPPGPFGPGSAMPLPGGNSPSSEYRVKASVTALRYCSPESPKFDRTVAEVWFRTVADAERVGFRPLT